MKKKEVLITIKGIYQSEGESNVIEMMTTGTYYKDHGEYCIAYEESEATGFGGTQTVLRVEKDRMVTLSRTGEFSSQLIIENGVRHQCHYGVGFGDLMIGVSCDHIHSTLNSAGGDLKLRYSLDINTLLTSENEMIVNVRECGKNNLSGEIKRS